MVRGTVLILAVLLSGCCTTQTPPVPTVQTVYVDRPIPVKQKPPAELMELRNNIGPLPVFVHPGDPGASSALTPDGERRLRALIERLLSGLEAWEALADGQSD